MGKDEQFDVSAFFWWVRKEQTPGRLASGGVLQPDIIPASGSLHRQDSALNEPRGFVHLNIPNVLEKRQGHSVETEDSEGNDDSSDDALPSLPLPFQIGATPLTDFYEDLRFRMEAENDKKGRNTKREQTQEDRLPDPEG
jgi:hypothetical protein